MKNEFGKKTDPEQRTNGESQTWWTLGLSAPASSDSLGIHIRESRSSQSTATPWADSQALQTWRWQRNTVNVAQPQILIQDSNTMARNAKTTIIFWWTWMFVWKYILSISTNTSWYAAVQQKKHNWLKQNYHIFNVPATQTLDNFTHQESNFLCAVPSPLPPPDEHRSSKSGDGWSANNILKIYERKIYNKCIPHKK